MNNAQINAKFLAATDYVSRGIMKYEKHIRITDTGMVVAEVYASDGRRTGLRFYTSMFPSTTRTEVNAKKAHEWADGHISMCARQET